MSWVRAPTDDRVFYLPYIQYFPSRRPVKRPKPISHRFILFNFSISSFSWRSDLISGEFIQRSCMYIKCCSPHSQLAFGIREETLSQIASRMQIPRYTDFIPFPHSTSCCGKVEASHKSQERPANLRVLIHYSREQDWQRAPLQGIHQWAFLLRADCSSVTTIEYWVQ